MTYTLYITPEQLGPLDKLLWRFRDNPTGLKEYLESRAMFTEPEFQSLYSMNKDDIMYACYEGYEIHYSPEHTVALTLQRWEKEHKDIVDDHDAFFANPQELHGKIHGAKYVLDTLGIKLPQQEEN